jgi:hypothetical protein
MKSQGSLLFYKLAIPLLAITFLVLLALNISTNPVYADDTDKELFTEMEADTKKGEAATQSSWIKQFGENIEGSVRLRYGHFFSTPHKTVLNDYDSDVGEALFRFSTWSGTDQFKVHFSGWAETGTQNDTYEGVIHWPIDNDEDRRYIELNELYALYSRDNMDFTIGKKLFNTGICTLFSPSDIFSPADLHDPMDSKQFGIWQIKTDYYRNNHTFELAVIPIYTETKPPPDDSRWWGDTAQQMSTLPSNINLNKDEPDISWEYASFFAKYKTTTNGWDLFLSATSGPSPYSVLKQEGLNIIEKRINIKTIAAGFSTTMGDFEIHGELFFNYSNKNRDDDYIKSVIGFNYTINDYARYLFMDEIIITVEYAKEKILDEQSAKGYIKSSEQGRPGKKDILVKLQFNYDEYLKFESLLHYEILNHAWMNQFKASYRFKEGWTLSGTIEFFDNKDQSGKENNGPFFEDISYSQWDKNDRFILSLKYEF